MPLEIITPATLALFRDIDEGAMPSECDLIVFATARGPAGTTLRTPVVVASSIPCRLTNLGASLPQIAAQLTPAGEYRVAVPITTDLTDVARLIVRGTTFGQPWAIELTDVVALEPRSYSSSRKMTASRATDTIAPTPDIGTVTVGPA